MKTFIILYSFMLCAATAMAQAPAISWYSAEGRDYYEVSGCRPGSCAAFYSSVSGGRYLGNSIVGPDGKAISRGSRDFRPAMVLNNGTGGSGYVSYTGSREFAIASPAVRGSGGAVTITWNGAATANEDIAFRVLSSTDGLSYRQAAVVSAGPGDAMAPYAYSEAWTGAAMLYKVEVVSNTKGARYITQPLLLAGTSAITVFPPPLPVTFISPCLVLQTVLLTPLSTAKANKWMAAA